MLDNVARPAVRQKRSKLAPTSCQASSMFAAGTTAVNVVGFFMALLSFRGFGTPSLPAQGEQRLPLIFNIQRGNAAAILTNELARPLLCHIDQIEAEWPTFHIQLD